ncbi:hypothetical protein H8D36_05300 [archaeon]|nr:hypothetical protein [archaeon]
MSFRYGTKLEQELKKSDGNDGVQVESVLGMFLNNPEVYDVVAFSDFSLRNSNLGRTNLYPVFANKLFRVGVGTIDEHIEDTGRTVEYGFIREGSDLVTALYVKAPEDAE